MLRGGSGRHCQQKNCTSGGGGSVLNWLTTGVEEPADVARYLLAGADAVMTASALIRHGRRAGYVRAWRDANSP